MKKLSTPATLFLLEEMFLTVTTLIQHGEGHTWSSTVVGEINSALRLCQNVYQVKYKVFIVILLLFPLPRC